MNKEKGLTSDMFKGLKITRLATFKPSNNINVALSKTLIKQKLRRIKKLNSPRTNKKYRSVMFMDIFSLELNLGGMFTYEQMEQIYATFTNPSTERTFEAELKKQGVSGYIRNMPMYNKWFPDFVWKNKKIIVEIDGPSHKRPEMVQKDAIKDRYLMEQGWTVFRLVVPYTKQQKRDLVCYIKTLL